MSYSTLLECTVPYFYKVSFDFSLWDTGWMVQKNVWIARPRFISSLISSWAGFASVLSSLFKASTHLYDVKLTVLGFISYFSMIELYAAAVISSNK